jgi:hypothetical protein
MCVRNHIRQDSPIPADSDMAPARHARHLCAMDVETRWRFAQVDERVRADRRAVRAFNDPRTR